VAVVYFPAYYYLLIGFSLMFAGAVFDDWL
jgi:hypothetical protein